MRVAVPGSPPIVMNVHPETVGLHHRTHGAIVRRRDDAHSTTPQPAVRGGATATVAGTLGAAPGRSGALGTSARATPASAANATSPTTVSTIRRIARLP